MQSQATQTPRTALTDAAPVPRPAGAAVSASADLHPEEPVREPRGARVLRDMVFPTLEAPRSDEPARLPHPTSDRDPASCVLIVDDNLLVRHTIRRMLSDEYETVIDAPDLDRAMHACADFEVRILILDLILPNREVTTNFREARRRFPRARVLAITGGGRSGPSCLLTVARKLGAFAALQKPFRRKTLLDILRTSESY